MVVVLGLSCFATCGIFLDQGSNNVSCLAGRFFTAEPPGKPLVLLPVVLHERTSIYLPTKLMGVGAVSSSFAVVNSLAVDTLPHALW